MIVYLAWPMPRDPWSIFSLKHSAMKVRYCPSHWEDMEMESERDDVHALVNPAGKTVWGSEHRPSNSQGSTPSLWTHPLALCSDRASAFPSS